MRERTLSLVGRGAGQVWMMTFHAFCVRFLRKEILAVPGFTQNFSIYDDSDSKSLMKSIIKDFNVSVEPAVILDWISKCKNELVGTKDFKFSEDAEEAFVQSKRLELYKEYQKRLKTFNALDFDDLLMFTAKILQKFPEVRARWQRQFSYLLVDEYQDTNHAQYVIVKLLFAHNLCVVGDVDQCIYGFRGADIRNINDFPKDYPSYKLVKLEQNYRSTGFILDAANAVIENNLMRPKKTLWTDADKGSKVNFRKFRTSNGEAAYVVSSIEMLRTKYGFSFSDISVLYRTNAQSRVIEESFLKAGIPYVLVGGLKFYDRREIKDILSYLRFMLNPYDVNSMLRAFKNPKRGVGDTTVRNLVQLASSQGIALYDLFSNIMDYRVVRPNVKKVIFSFMEYIQYLKLSDMSVSELICEIIFRTNYKEMLMKEYPEDYDERFENLSELVNIAKSFEDENEGASDLSSFMDRISLMTDLDQKNIGSNDAVTLMTVHGSKGLEFPVVFMVGMEEMIFPHLQANIFTEDDCRFVYKELKKKEARRMAHLERSCLKDWQKDYENRERRSMDWERSGVDHVRQKYGLDPEIDAHRAFKETLSDSKPLREGAFDEFLKSGKLPETPELDMSGVGTGRDVGSKGKGRV